MLSGNSLISKMSFGYGLTRGHDDEIIVQFQANHLFQDSTFPFRLIDFKIDQLSQGANLLSGCGQVVNTGIDQRKITVLAYIIPMIIAALSGPYFFKVASYSLLMAFFSRSQPAVRK